jgi:hypothetical protein
MDGGKIRMESFSENRGDNSPILQNDELLNYGETNSSLGINQHIKPSWQNKGRRISNYVSEPISKPIYSRVIYYEPRFNCANLLSN